MITHHRFGLNSPNLHQTCIMGYSRLVFKIKVIDLALQCHLGNFDSKLYEIWLVWYITCNEFKLESLNLYQVCILRFPQLVLKIGVIDLDLQGHLAILTQNSKKQHPTLLFYTDVGWPRGVTRPKCAHFLLLSLCCCNDIMIMLDYTCIS